MPLSRGPSAVPRGTVLRLSVVVRIICATGFIFTSFVPSYVPHASSGEELPPQELLQDQFLLVEEGFVMKSSSISETGHRLAYTQGITHRTEPQESIHSIAKLYNISVDTVRFANNLAENAVLHPGDKLLILPVDGVLHTVGRGQSLHKISQLYDVSLEVVEKQNQLTSERIYAGQQIIVPGGKPIVASRTPTQVAAVPRAELEPARPRPTPPPDAAPPPSHGIFQKPCDCTYTQYYRPSHYAVDLAQRGGGPIFAAEDGIVIRTDYGWNGGYGNVVEIDHGGGLVTLYAHNKSIHVREGQAVKRGGVIASMGNTGKVYGRTGIHVHFEVILNGIKKNPTLYLQ